MKLCSLNRAFARAPLAAALAKPARPVVEAPADILRPQAKKPARAAGIVTAVALCLGALGVSGCALKATRTPAQPAAAASRPAETAAPLVETKPLAATSLPPTATRQPTSTYTPSPAIGSTQVWAKDGMVGMYVPAGEFLMGAWSGDDEAGADERPQHTVYLDAFWIDQTEVTNAMYAECVNHGGCTVPSSIRSYTRSGYYADSQYADYPMISADWNQASAYCEWAGRRLPTEAEWEKAARGTDGRMFPWGNEAPDSSRLNYLGNVGDTTEVGSYPSGASPYGALDMAGNSWEWVADWYGESYYSSSPSSNPEGPASGDRRVMRGGNCDVGLYGVRASYRLRIGLDFRGGFRCVRSP